MIDISIITPCYNTGKYLKDAVNSVLDYKGSRKYEIVIINDGSTDEQTLELLDELTRSNTEIVKVLHQPNRGAPAARNAGSKLAGGKYLLFLDSDNMINPDYIDIGIEQLERNDKLGVVYGKPQFIGDSSRNSFTTGLFDIDHLLAYGYIDMCAVVRKEAWESVNGFEEGLRAFQEWEFWLSLHEKKWDFHFVDMELFIYRIRANSVADRLIQHPEIRNEVYDVISKKHHRIYFDHYRSLYTTLRVKEKDIRIGSAILGIPRLVKKFFGKFAKDKTP